MSSLALLASLFADTRDDPLSRPEILWGTIGLTLALLVGAGIIYAVDRWRKRLADGTHDAESLTSYRDMYEAGEITEAEYIELKRRLAEKVKRNPAAGTIPFPGAPMPPVQPGERATMNPPTPPTTPTESPPPPSSA